MNHGPSVGGTNFRSLGKTNRLVNHQLKMGGFWQKIMENLQIPFSFPDISIVGCIFVFFLPGADR